MNSLRHSLAALGPMDDDFWGFEANSVAIPQIQQPSSPHTRQDFNSLTLPSINPNNNSNQLPPLDGLDFFDLNYDLNFSPPESERIPSPPSNAHTRARAASPIASSSHYGGLEDDEFTLTDLVWDRTPPPEMAPRATNNGRSTRAGSAVVDLTSSPVWNTDTRKRKASSPSTSRAGKARRRNSASSVEVDLDNVPQVDLSAVNDKSEYEQQRAKELDENVKQKALAESTRPVKLAEFQCIICMDNPTDLTITHCGHLFCSECLHSALHAGDKKCCPVCRANIGVGRHGAKTPKNGIYALEMKLVTSNKKGKRAVRT